MMIDRVRLLFWTMRYRFATRRLQWKHRNAVIMSTYDQGRIFWRVAEPIRASDLLKTRSGR